MIWNEQWKMNVLRMKGHLYYVLRTTYLYTTQKCVCVYICVVYVLCVMVFLHVKIQAHATHTHTHTQAHRKLDVRAKEQEFERMYEHTQDE